jgi:hypothetical protein
MKNWLFFGSKEAGHQAAAIYTIIENCHRYDVPVEDYLRKVLEILPTLRDPESQAADLTPASTAPARRKDPRTRKSLNRLCQGGRVGSAYSSPSKENSLQ